MAGGGIQKTVIFQNEADVLSFDVQGTPMPQGSKHAFVVKGTNRASIVDHKSPELKEWRRLVGVAAARAVAFSDDDRLQVDALQLDVTFFMPRPRSHYRTGRNAHLLKDSAPEFPSGKPDCDKLMRAVGDALTVLVWKDDAQVIDLHGLQLYADGCEPGCHVTVRSVYE